MGIASRIAAVTENLGGDYPTGGIQHNLGKLEQAAQGGGGVLLGGFCTLKLTGSSMSVVNIVVGDNATMSETGQGAYCGGIPYSETTIFGGGAYVYTIIGSRSTGLQFLAAPLTDGGTPEEITPISIAHDTSHDTFTVVFRLPVGGAQAPRTVNINQVNA